MPPPRRRFAAPKGENNTLKVQSMNNYTNIGPNTGGRHTPHAVGPPMREPGRCAMPPPPGRPSHTHQKQQKHPSRNNPRRQPRALCKKTRRTRVNKGQPPPFFLHFSLIFAKKRKFSPNSAIFRPCFSSLFILFIIAVGSVQGC